MKKSFLFLLIILTILVTGCGIDYKIVKDHDQFENRDKIYMKFNMLASYKSNDSNYFFDLYKSVAPDKAENYFILIRYIGKDWAFIKKGESLVLLVDGQKVAFSGDGSGAGRTITSAGVVSEVAAYQIDKREIASLCAAKKIDVRIYGDNYTSDCYFLPDNFERLNQFYHDYVM